MSGVGAKSVILQVWLLVGGGDPQVKSGAGAARCPLDGRRFRP